MSETCTTCGLPQELCVCSDVEKTDTTATIETDERRYGKVVTLVYGIEGEIDTDDLSSHLKSNLACGGTIQDDGAIMLQGEHVERTRELLEAEGLNVEVEQ
jgi:translation initiation factor 1